MNVGRDRHPEHLETDDCPHCGYPLTFGGYAIACGEGDTSYRIRLPDFCNRAECRTARDEAAIARMIAAGVIDP